MKPDNDLLRQFMEGDSEDAFAELVQRHLNLVYSAALRQVDGDTALAQDVSQMVFTDLARKAGTLSRRPMLAGWLYTSTHYAAAKAVRAERRRQAREQEAHIMSALCADAAPEPEWHRLRPVLDQAMQELRELDRQAILLRFFENRRLEEVGRKLGLSENAARMRVDRALEKLRKRLIDRGVTTTAAILSMAISANAIQTAPAGLVTTLTSASLLGATGGGTAFSVFKLMSMTKVKAGLIGSVIVASTATSLVVQHQWQARLDGQDGLLQQQSEQLSQLQTENERLLRPARQTNYVQVVDTNELEKLRAEAEPLRRQAGELSSLQQEKQRLQAMVQNEWVYLRNHGETNLISTNNVAALKDKESYALHLATGMHEYASEHNGQFPTNLSQALPYLSKAALELTNVSPDQFEIMFHGSRNDMAQYAHPNQIILVKEKQPWRNTDGQWVIAWASLNGMGKVSSPMDGHFQDWLANHTLQAAREAEQQ